MIKLKHTIYTFLFILAGCSSTRMISDWKNPDIVIFDAYKVLVVGMTNDEQARIEFETKLVDEIISWNIEAVRSVDLFDVDFTSSMRSEKDLDIVEQQLLDKDFDAILLTKILGSENRKTFRKKISSLNNYYRFSDDYLNHQPVFYEDDYYDNYIIYHAETSLYCICVDKERELIWRGAIDITDPIDISKTINDYIELLTKSMEEQQIIFRKESFSTISK